MTQADLITKIRDHYRTLRRLAATPVHRNHAARERQVDRLDREIARAAEELMGMEGGRRAVGLLAEEVQLADRLAAAKAIAQPRPELAVRLRRARRELRGLCQAAA